MSWFSQIFSSGAGEVIGKIGDTIDQFHLSGEEKQKFKLQLEQLVVKRESEIEQTVRKNLEARQEIITAELNQNDTYTKRARPTVVYFGLVMIFINYLVVPLLQTLTGNAVEPFPLPGEFWAAWGGIVATWAIGRSFEKVGVSSKMSRAATGNKKSLSLLDDEEIVG